VLQEGTFKSGSDIHHFLPWWGLLGFIITAAESYFFGELTNVIEVYTLNYEIGLLFLAFVATLTIFTSITPFFVKRSSASMFNIAIISKIFWSYLVEVLSGEEYPRTYFYYIGIAIILIGIFLFNMFAIVYKKKSELQTNLIESKPVDTASEFSSSSAFSVGDRKYTHIKNNTLSLKANKYLNNDV
jgi:hypothetical protein